MSYIDMKLHKALAKEAKVYLKDIEALQKLSVMRDDQKLLTQEHIMEWLEVFYEDKIKMDTCNEARVKR